MPSHFFMLICLGSLKRASANGPPGKLEGANANSALAKASLALRSRCFARPQPAFTHLSLCRLGDLPREPEAFQNHSSVTLRRPSSPKVAKPLLTRRPSTIKSALAFDLLHALLRSRLTPPHSFLQPAKSRLILIKRKGRLKVIDGPPGKLEGALSVSPGKLEGTRCRSTLLLRPTLVYSSTPFWVMTYYIAFVGASVLPSGYTAAVRSAVSSRLASLDSSSVVVVSGGAHGVDTVAENVALQMGFECLIYKPQTQDWPGYKARNILIAQKANDVVVITMPLLKGGRKGDCYHCNSVGKNNQHQVSGGCWTGKQHRGYEVVVLPSLSYKQISTLDGVDLHFVPTDLGLFKHSILGMNEIFVFGSNLAGIHGAGAALFAQKNHGATYVKNVTAKWGVVGKNGVGMQGTAYAIPTKDEWIKTLPIESIAPYVKEFVEFAKANTATMNFNVARVGCGLAGYKEADIAPLFEGSPSNVKFNWTEWTDQPYVCAKHIYSATYDSTSNDPWEVETDV